MPYFPKIKKNIFLIKNIGDRDVSFINGIGKKTGENLNQNGYTKVLVLI